MKLKAKIIGSKVQNIGYRIFMLNRAEEIGLSGYEAQNRKENGTQVVHVFMEGDEPQIAQMKDFIEQERPPGAKVSSIVFDEHQGTVLDIDKFHQRTNTHQLTKGINALLSIDNKQDKMLEKQDRMLDQQSQMLEKQDKMLEKQDKMLEKQDILIDKQDTTIGILKEVKEDTSCIKSDISALRKDTSEALYEKYEQLSKEIAEIKTTLTEIKAKVA